MKKRISCSCCHKLVDSQALYCPRCKAEQFVRCDTCGICIGRAFMEKETHRFGDRTICTWCLK